MQKKDLYIIIGGIILALIIGGGLGILTKNKVSENVSGNNISFFAESLATTTLSTKQISWKNFTNGTFGYSISYPDNFGFVKENDSDIKIDFPKTYSEGTNLREAFVSVKLSDDDEKTCHKPEQENLSPKEEIISGKKFFSYEVDDAGAGNFYHKKVYSVMNNICTKIIFQTHSVNIDILNAGLPKEKQVEMFDGRLLEDTFENIFDTFVLFDQMVDESSG